MLALLQRFSAGNSAAAPARLTPEEFSRILICIRAGLGHRHGPHRDPGNCRRSSSRAPAMRGGEVLRPPCLRPPDFSMAAGQA